MVFIITKGSYRIFSLGGGGEGEEREREVWESALSVELVYNGSCSLSAYTDHSLINMISKLLGGISHPRASLSLCMKH